MTSYRMLRAAVEAIEIATTPKSRIQALLELLRIVGVMLAEAGRNE